MASPVSLGHSEYDFLIRMWLGAYVCGTPGSAGGANGTWLMLESAPQPDACLRILPQCGGQSRTEGLRGRRAGVGGEVSGSSAVYDSGAKMALCQRAGVREYPTLSLSPPKVVWRVLRDGACAAIEPGEDGILRSDVFPGLWLDPKALLAEDGPRVLAALNQGLASPEHTGSAAIVCYGLGILTASGLAQTITASITGTVSDATGAAIPGAKVVATSNATALTYTAQTNGAGVYNLPFLPVGAYNVVAENTGFKRATLGPFTLEVNQIAPASTSKWRSVNSRRAWK